MRKTGNKYLKWKKITRNDEHHHYTHRERDTHKYTKTPTRCTREQAIEAVFVLEILWQLNCTVGYPCRNKCTENGCRWICDSYFRRNKSKTVGEHWSRAKSQWMNELLRETRTRHSVTECVAVKLLKITSTRNVKIDTYTKLINTHTNTTQTHKMMPKIFLPNLIDFCRNNISKQAKKNTCRKKAKQ